MNAPLSEKELTGAAAIPGSSPADADDPALWYKDAVIYQLNVKAFFDSNGDGVGDFSGVAQQLDYVKDLGVNTIWLMPFYPSPLRDDGYDISDYMSVHPQYGTLEDFKAMLDAAHQRELRVITELVINHTSDRHPWFQRARNAPAGSPERDFYVWSDTEARYQGTRIIFTDTETSNWTWDPVAKAYYWHRFFSHQPDLNFDNPLVLEAVLEVMRFWLDLGVDGFRLDAIPYLIERDGTNNENLPETHAVIRELRAAIDAGYPGKFLLAEANQWPEDVREYFGDGDECHACYHFPLMPRMYMAIAQEDRFPVVEIMAQTPDIPPNCQWTIFLRNHDELTLEMVTSRERDYMYTTYAADPQARINLGIRRRLAPLMQNDIDRIQLMNSLLLSMPGSPIVYYGDEIGMGDNVFIGDRNGVRTPMQWSPDRNAGFSRADPQRLYLQPIMDAIYGFQAVNVESQLRDPSSLLHWMRRMLATRRATRAFGRGSLGFLPAGNRKVLAYLREYGDDVILCVANLSRSAQPVELDLGRYRGRVPVEMLGRTAFPPIGELPYLLTMAGYGFYWFRLAADAPVPAWHVERLPAEDRPVLVLFDGWWSLFRDQVVPWRIGLAMRIRERYDAELLPGWLRDQRWFAAKGEKLGRATLVDHLVWESADDAWLLQLVDVPAGGTRCRYFVPLALAWEERDEERMRLLAPHALARVRQQAQVGVIGDAFADEPFCRAVLAAIVAGTRLKTAGGALRFVRTSALDGLLDGDPKTLPIGRPHGLSSNTVVTIDDKLFLKGYRLLRPGVNPEVEVGRFLTEVARFANAVPVAGVVEHVDAGGTVTALALLQAFVANQGDGWEYAVDYLGRHLELHRGTTAAPPADAHGGFLALVDTLGRRTAEMHRALATPSGDPAFEPESFDAEYLADDRTRAAQDLAATLDLLAARLAGPSVDKLSADARALAETLLAQRAALQALVDRDFALPALRRTRIHGDYHLGQVLVTRNDFVIIDFEGEPARPLEERRAKLSPLRDVAGMLRSFDYAALSSLRGAAHTPDELAALAPLAERWRVQVRAAFVAGYSAAAPASIPAGAAGSTDAGAAAPRELLALYELTKALYELRYELNHRPDWVDIPLRGLLALAGTATSGDHDGPR